MPLAAEIRQRRFDYSFLWSRISIRSLLDICCECSPLRFFIMTTTKIKTSINKCLAPVNLRLETLTADRREAQRLAQLHSKGAFDIPRFELARALAGFSPRPLLDHLSAYTSCFERWRDASTNSVGYTFNNDYFSSPDAEVLYTLVRTFKPKTIIEVGSGNSTRISRLAISDGHLETALIAVDPNPRKEVRSIADEVVESLVEMIPDRSFLSALEPNDILFIDSSHFLQPGNDVAVLYTDVVPRLKPGVLVHIHDIFLPYDYPYSWLERKELRFSEAYLVHLLLTSRNDLEIIWPAYYLQKMMPEFKEYFPNCGEGVGTSLWFRVGTR